MTRALVLGATGHIGAHIVRALLAAGHEVRAAYRSERFLGVLDDLPLDRVRVDVNIPEQLRAALTGCDWVFHAAAYYPNFRETPERAVAEGQRSIQLALEEIAQAHPARIVFTSSAATVRQAAGRAATEADIEPWPLEQARPLYATAKIAIEHEVLAAARGGMPIIVVNPSVCLGEYDARPFSGRTILAFAKYRLPVYLEQTFNAVYTGDVGVGHVRAAERGRVGERYLLSCTQVTMQEFAALVAQVVGGRAPRWCLPHGAAMVGAALIEGAAWLLRRPPPVTRQMLASLRQGQRLDGSKAQRELGIPQTPIEEAIRRAVTWFKSHGYI